MNKLGLCYPIFDSVYHIRLQVDGTMHPVFFEGHSSKSGQLRRSERPLLRLKDLVLKPGNYHIELP